MMQSIDLRGRALDALTLRHLIPRPVVDVAVASAAARELIDDVAERGEDALLEQSERFDGVRPGTVRVAQSDIDAAVDAMDPSVRLALEEAIRRITTASAAQVPGATRTELARGGVVEQRWHPVERVGLYVPGGKAVYPSSVVMNVVPALVAGVRSIALGSPAQKEHGGRVHPTILAAAGLLGITEIYAMGGAGAIGAFAHGVPGVGLAPVDVITGPGNVFVAAAKRLVKGLVGIDSEAGTTEILVIADDSADPRLVAYDLVSQAEHDEAAASLVVTDSETLARSVRDALPSIVSATRHHERVRTALSGPQSAIVLVDDLAAAAAFSNVYGPEHLELQVADDDALLELIHSAGAVFVGPHSPVSLGDYLAGSNHVLPTGGGARFASGLGAFTFLRPQQIVRYSGEALAEVADHIVALSDAEALPAHGEAVTARFTTPHAD
jgi:histidinol dehydrogenase